jgi:hypothetical protein
VITGANVGDGGTGEFVTLGVKVGVALAVGEEVITGVSDGEGAVGVESSALTELTVNCNIGHKIKVAISNRIEEVVNTTPRDTRVREGWNSPSSTSDLHS